MGSERQRDVQAFIQAVNEFLNDYVEEADTLVGGAQDDFVVVPSQIAVPPRARRNREPDPR